MLIIANWKAYIEDAAKAKALTARARRLARGGAHEIVLAPPSPFLAALAARKGALAFAAQDVSAGGGGAHTGENTAAAFAAAGATYAIVGHSERRAAGDTNATVAERLAHAVAQELTPVLCVGERERDAAGQYLTFVREEIASAFAALSPRDRSRVVIAYEPIWAIGKTAADAIDPADLTEMVLYIRKVLAETLPGKSSAGAKVLYGGSVEPGNARTLAAASGIDGFLIGHASADPRTFAALVKELS